MAASSLSRRLPKACRSDAMPAAMEVSLWRDLIAVCGFHEGLVRSCVSSGLPASSAHHYLQFGRLPSGTLLCVSGGAFTLTPSSFYTLLHRFAKLGADIVRPPSLRVTVRQYRAIVRPGLASLTRCILQGATATSQEHLRGRGRYPRPPASCGATAGRRVQCEGERGPVTRNIRL